MIVTDKLSTESLHAFIDEQLTDEQYTQVESQLDAIPEKVIEIQQCQIINERLREIFDPVVAEEIPETLLELGFNGLPADYPVTSSQQPEQDATSLAMEMAAGQTDELTSPGLASMQDTAFDPRQVQTEQLQADYAALSEMNSELHDTSEIADQSRQHARKPRRMFAQPVPVVSSDEHEQLLKSIESLALETQDSTPADSAAQPDDATLQQAVNAATTDDLIEDTIQQALELEPSTATEYDDLEQAEYHLPEHDLDSESAQDEIVSTTAPADEANGLNLNEPSDAADAILAQYVQQSSAVNMHEQPDITQSELEPASESVISVDTGSAEIDTEADYRDYEIPDLDVLNEQQAYIKSQLEAVNMASMQSSVNNDTGDLDLNSYPDDVSSQDAVAYVEQLYADSAQDVEDHNAVPNDVVAEFFSQRRTEMDFEVNEVIKHFDELSGNIAHATVNHIVDNNPVLKFKNKLIDAMIPVRKKISGFKSRINTVSSGIFNAIENTRARFATKTAPVANTANTQFISPTSESADAVSEIRADVEDIAYHVQHNAIETSASNKQQIQSARVKLLANLIHYESNFKEQPLAKRLPEKVRIYSIYVAGLLLELFKVYRVKAFNYAVDQSQVLGSKLATMTPENKMTMGGSVLLVIGLIIGGSLVSLFGHNSVVMLNDTMENLAIDAHVLYNQQKQNLANNETIISSEALKSLPEQMSRSVRLVSTTQVAGFLHLSSLLIPTEVGYATVHTYQNKSDQIITLLLSVDPQADENSPVTCRVLKNIDGLCSWTLGSVRYIAVANLSSSRVREFSQQLLEKL